MSHLNKDEPRNDISLLLSLESHLLPDMKENNDKSYFCYGKITNYDTTTSICKSTKNQSICKSIIHLGICQSTTNRTYNQIMFGPKIAKDEYIEMVLIEIVITRI